MPAVSGTPRQGRAARSWACFATCLPTVMTFLLLPETVGAVLDGDASCATAASADARVLLQSIADRSQQLAKHSATSVHKLASNASEHGVEESDDAQDSVLARRTGTGHGNADPDADFLSDDDAVGSRGDESDSREGGAATRSTGHLKMHSTIIEDDYVSDDSKVDPEHEAPRGQLRAATAGSKRGKQSQLAMHTVNVQQAKATDGQQHHQTRLTQQGRTRDTPDWVTDFTHGMGWGQPHSDSWDYDYEHDPQEDAEMSEMGGGSKAEASEGSGETAGETAGDMPPGWGKFDPANVKKHSHTTDEGVTHHYHSHRRMVPMKNIQRKMYRWKFHGKQYSYAAPGAASGAASSFGSGEMECTTVPGIGAKSLGILTNIAPPGTPCVFGVDPRDEGSHCIVDGTGKEFAGDFGWCYTTDDKVEWGYCGPRCPVFGLRKGLNDRLTMVGVKMQALLAKVKSMPDYCKEKGCKVKAAAGGKKKKKAKLVETAEGVKDDVEDGEGAEGSEAEKRRSPEELGEETKMEYRRQPDEEAAPLLSNDQTAKRIRPF